MTPGTKQFAPRPYQRPIIDYIAENQRCAIWASMGAGKTVSVLTALTEIDFLEGDVFPALIIAPLRVARTTWPDEVQKWAHLNHLRVRPIVGSVADRRHAVQGPADIYTINYEQLPWLVEHFGARWPFKTVVADESTKLKGLRVSVQTSPAGRQFLRCGGGTERAKSLAQMVYGGATRRFIELTGTPSPNGLQDLWGQAWFLDQGKRLGNSYSDFSDRWFRTDRSGYGLKPFEHTQGEIEQRLSDICLTIDMRDYIDLKEPVVVPVYVDLGKKAMEFYKQMEKEMFIKLAETERTAEAVNAAAKTNKCLQLANGAIYLDPDADGDQHPKAKDWEPVHDAKLDALEDIVEEASGMPVLVAFHFKSDLARLRKRFLKGRVLDSNPKTIEEWNRGEIPVLFAHPASCGHGLNLQDGGNILVYFAHWWNLEERMQILERIGPARQFQAGYDRPVYVYNIIARDTVDELVIERTTSKREVQDILLDAMKGKG